MLIKTYGIAIEKPHKLQPLKLPVMTLAEAEKTRARYAEMGKTVHVINLKSE